MLNYLLLLYYYYIIIYYYYITYFVFMWCLKMTLSAVTPSIGTEFVATNTQQTPERRHRAAANQQFLLDCGGFRKQYYFASKENSAKD